MQPPAAATPPEEQPPSARRGVDAQSSCAHRSRLQRLRHKRNRRRSDATQARRVEVPIEAAWDDSGHGRASDVPTAASWGEFTRTASAAGATKRWQTHGIEVIAAADWNDSNRSISVVGAN
jgi:hypothetical protein